VKEDLEHALWNNETDYQDTALRDKSTTEVKTELTRIGYLGENEGRLEGCAVRSAFRAAYCHVGNEESTM
jgi:hypothetical protein